MGERGPSLRIVILGGFRAFVDDVEVNNERWPRQKARTLVKLLALAPRHRLHQEQLMESLWPEAQVDAAANNLNKMIHMVRRALEPTLASGATSAFLARESGQIVLRAPGDVSVDADQFESAAELALSSGNVDALSGAIALFGGEVLPEDRYEAWTTSRRDYLRRLHHELLWKAAEVERGAGRLDAAVERLTELIAAEPANEAAHRGLMEIFTAKGRRELAMRQYESCREAVRRELGAQLDPATLALHDRIRSGRMAAELEPKSRTVDRDALAVLPFLDTSKDQGLGYLCEGLAETLISNLSQLPSLRVLALGTVSRFRGNQGIALDPQAAGRDLGVQSVLVGRVLQWSERLIVSVELVRVEDGSLLWGEQYNRAPDDVFEVQRSIAREISEKLRLRLSGPDKARLDRRHTASTEAYELYLRGRHHWNKRNADGLRQAIDYFQQAIDVDPVYALAYSGLADCFNLLSLYSVVAPVEAMPRARSAALRALEIDDRLAEAHTSLAYTRLYYDWDWSAAEAGFARAIELSPNYATAHQWQHEYLTAHGRFEEQSAAIRQAETLDPLSPIIKTEVGWGLYFARQYDLALRHLGDLLELEPRFAVAHLIEGLVYQQQGRLDAAIGKFELAVELSASSPFALALGALGHALGRSGRTIEARAQLAALERLAEQAYVSAVARALVHVGLDDRDAALDWLERGHRERDDRVIYVNVEPMFDGLRDEPRFQRLTESLGL